jgi:hypothetical protein
MMAYGVGRCKTGIVEKAVRSFRNDAVLKKRWPDRFLGDKVSCQNINASVAAYRRSAL